MHVTGEYNAQDRNDVEAPAKKTWVKPEEVTEGGGGCSGSSTKWLCGWQVKRKSKTV